MSCFLVWPDLTDQPCLPLEVIDEKVKPPATLGGKCQRFAKKKKAKENFLYYINSNCKCQLCISAQVCMIESTDLTYSELDLYSLFCVYITCLYMFIHCSLASSINFEKIIFNLIKCCFVQKVYGKQTQIGYLISIVK